MNTLHFSTAIKIANRKVNKLIEYQTINKKWLLERLKPELDCYLHY